VRGIEHEMERAQSLVDQVLPGWMISVRTPVFGGTAATMHRLDLVDGLGATRVVIERRPGSGYFLRQSGAFAREAVATRLAHDAGLPVAEVLGFGEDWSIAQWIDGAVHSERAVWPGYAMSMATILARLHSVAADAVTGGLGDGWMPDHIARTRDMVGLGAISEMPADRQPLLERLAEVWPHVEASTAPAVFLHGDLWPGNVLWTQKRLAAVIDWENCAVGAWQADVLSCRLELSMAHGSAIAQEFVDAYCAQTGRQLEDEHESFVAWSVVAVLRLASLPGSPELTPAESDQMAAHLAVEAERALRL
jgi:aminoglycoside phosphotransferase (APT) family kinase protein